MSIAALAAVSRDGTPLYLRDFLKSIESDLVYNFGGLLDDDHYYDDDGFFGDVISPSGAERSARLMEEWPCRLKYQFILHSACHRLYEVLAENQWKAPSAVGMDACWVGYLCSSDNFRAYGYVTTNLRYVTLVEDSIDNTQTQRSRGTELCMLMSDVHRLYTESLLNPFAPLHDKITSKRFDSGVNSLVQTYNGPRNN